MFKLFNPVPGSRVLIVRNLPVSKALFVVTTLFSISGSITGFKSILKALSSPRPIMKAGKSILPVPIKTVCPAQTYPSKEAKVSAPGASSLNTCALSITNAYFLVRRVAVPVLAAKDSSENETCRSIRERITSVHHRLSISHLESSHPLNFCC
jgi:hypothetical protein